METSEPDRLYIVQADREDKYDKLRGRGSPLEGQATKVVFLLAMLKGRALNKFPELGPKRDGLVRTSYLLPRDRALIYAVAVAHAGSLDVLMDKKQTFEIAERYATGGIQALMDEVFDERDASTFERRLELQARDLLSKVKFEDFSAEATPPGSGKNPLA
jgi:hypothetical protein